MPTIAESFLELMPVLQIEQPLQKPRPIQVSASSTARVDPLIAWQPADSQELFDYSSWIFQGDQTPNSLLHPMPRIEAFHNLRSEGDVVRASHLYLLHPVNEAIRHVTGGNPQIICAAEETHGAVARTDISWSYDNGEERTVFAILEFKNTFVLDWAEFEPAMADMTEGRTPAELIDRIYQECDDEEYSWLGKNARIISKQAKKYFERTECADIAIFDWNSMFIFDFSVLDEGANQLARGIWFREDPNQQYRTFRLLLFGLLCKAMRRWQII